MFEKNSSLAGYKIVDKIGSGGMGDVYKARQESLNRVVALKVLPPELLRNKEFAERFHSEAKLISMLEHHNIVTVYDFGEDNGKRFFAMQYVEGQSLNEIIEEHKSLEIPRIIHYTRQILRALKYAHEHKIIHRDIKPHNVLIDNTGKVFVSDFGIAKLFANTRITNTGMAVGTPEYMSPEQAEGKVLDVRTDIYSLGILIYELLVGMPPFTAESPLAVAYKQVNENPKNPANINKKTPKRLGLIVLKALKKNRKERYQTAAEMLDDLDSVIESESLQNSKVTYIKKGTDLIDKIPNRRLTDRRMGGRRKVNRRDLKNNPFTLNTALLSILIILVAIILFRSINFFPPKLDIITNMKIDATSSLTEMSGEKSDVAFLNDNNLSTVWAEGVKGAGKGEYVMFVFKHPMLLSRIGIWGGYCNKNKWELYNRPKKIELRLGNGHQIIVELKDENTGQFFNLPLEKTTYLRVAFVDFFKGENENITPISEIKIWGMKAN